MVATALLLLPLLAASALSLRCPHDSLAVYRLQLDTHWTSDIFPKQYPEVRPPAQWSRLLGRSHDDTFELFSEGSLASQALKVFAEVGKADLFDSHRQGFDGVMDTFGGAAIPQGEGQTTAKFYLDSNHSKVSLVVRMVPSPDWFIGVNSIDLCGLDGEWVENKHLQLAPMDAGTDTGFTFTSPNWPSDPQQPISIITAQYPDHPASSFFYPELTHLPVIATVKFTKLESYKLKQEFAPRPVKRHELIADEDMLNSVLPSRILSVGAASPQVVSLAGVLGVPQPHNGGRKRLAGNKLRSLRMRKMKNRRRRKNINQQMGDEEQLEVCSLSEWTEWSPCSATCGTGAATRRRTVLKKGKRCPHGLLEQSTWCSGYAECAEKFFKW